MLPDGFYFKTLDISYYKEIWSLICNHYHEDSQHLSRFTYSKDFIYWYLKNIPDGFILGLIYNSKLVGIIAATFIDMIIDNNKMTLPYINLLCLQSKIRNYGLESDLLFEIKRRLSTINLNTVFSATVKFNQSFCVTKDFVIPINYSFLKKIEFLSEDLPAIRRFPNNPLHLMTDKDIDSVTFKLNNFLEKFTIKPNFTPTSTKHFLLPRKNIVYSFVKRNHKKEPTDFVSIYKSYWYCIDKKEMVSIASLAFYFHETMDLTELIAYLLDKLITYKIDQLIFKDIMNNTNIDITKFSTYEKQQHCIDPLILNPTDASKIAIFPF